MDEYCICGHHPHTGLCGIAHCACFRYRPSLSTLTEFDERSEALIRLSRAPSWADMEAYIKQQRAAGDLGFFQTMASLHRHRDEQ